MQVMPKKHAAMAASAAILAVVVVWQIFSNFDGLGRSSATADPIASTTESALPESASTSTSKKELPPEPVFVLPEGAMAIDDYAYIENGAVYFKTLVAGNSPLPVLNADPKSFKRLQSFSTYPGSDVVRDCGASPIYTFYIDNYRPYFYQVWRAPEFRATQVDAMNGAKVQNFSVTSLTAANDGRTHFDIAYYKTGTSTCRLQLDQTRL
jgi:hypothetical protein